MLHGVIIHLSVITEALHFQLKRYNTHNARDDCIHSWLVLYHFIAYQNSLG